MFMALTFMTRPLFTHVYGTLCCITATCSGNVVLRHKLNTLKLAHDASATDVANGLMNLPNSKHESAVFTAGSPVTAVMSGAATLCSTAGTTTAITFSGETGALPSIDVQSNQLASTATTPTIYFETVQTLTCVMTGAASGSFALELDGVTTDDIAFDASAATIQTQLTTMYVQELRERIPAQAAPTHCARVPSRERRCEPLKRSYSRFKTRSARSATLARSWRVHKLTFTPIPSGASLNMGSRLVNAFSLVKSMSPCFGKYRVRSMSLKLSECSRRKRHLSFTAAPLLLLSLRCSARGRSVLSWRHFHAF